MSTTSTLKFPKIREKVRGAIRETIREKTRKKIREQAATAAAAAVAAATQAEVVPTSRAVNKPGGKKEPFYLRYVSQRAPELYCKDNPV